LRVAGLLRVAAPDDAAAAPDEVVRHFASEARGIAAAIGAKGSTTHYPHT